MKKRTVKVICDPGHGWGSVAKKDIIELCIVDKITGYSYENGNRVYLEEDMDLNTFLKASEKASWKINLKESHSDRRSWVRNYNRFTKECVS